MQKLLTGIQSQCVGRLFVYLLGLMLNHGRFLSGVSVLLMCDYTSLDVISLHHCLLWTGVIDFSITSLCVVFPDC